MEEIKIGQRFRTNHGTVFRRLSESRMVCEEAVSDRRYIGITFPAFDYLYEGWEILPDKSDNFNSLYEKLADI